MDTESNHRNRLIAAAILMAAISLYLILDLVIAVSLNLVISGGFAVTALALFLFIVGPLPLRQKLLVGMFVVTAVFSVRYVDWDGRKAVRRDFNQIQSGMTAEEVDDIMAGYNKTISPFVNQSLQGDIQIGTITYLPPADKLENTQQVSITFAGGRVIASTFYSE